MLNTQFLPVYRPYYTWNQREACEIHYIIKLHNQDNSIPIAQVLPVIVTRPLCYTLGSGYARLKTRNGWYLGMVAPISSILGL